MFHSDNGPEKIFLCFRKTCLALGLILHFSSLAIRQKLDHLCISQVSMVGLSKPRNMYWDWEQDMPPPQNDNSFAEDREGWLMIFFIGTRKRAGLTSHKCLGTFSAFLFCFVLVLETQLKKDSRISISVSDCF